MPLADLFNITNLPVESFGVSSGVGVLDILDEEDIDWSAVEALNVRSVQESYWDIEAVFLDGSSAIVDFSFQPETARQSANALSAAYDVPVRTIAWDAGRITRRVPRANDGDFEGVAA